ncbi:Iron-sulfur cluster assembly 2-like protein [Colletotrichum sidae]|uniref:Iron-sulfur cluster assembly 2-like protein n=1 Tax=Colletotrichum sidae TaxID=1347389 RepID=A0A4R8TIN4_9PEZI|nr:Iron-sulfur cluster assembly 2-like protein [Colletotrichum sidae]
MATISLRCVHAPSSANVFIQLARQSAPPPTILSLLLPRRNTGISANRRYSTEDSSRRRAASSMLTRRTFAQTRSFTVSSTRRQTRCVRNPTTDEDGNEMVLEITDRAGKRLSQIMKKDNNPNLALKIQVESGGCHGFQYLMSLITLPTTSDTTSGDWSSFEDDVVFEYLPDEAEASTPVLGGPKVLIDQPSLDLLKGSKVDFTMELIGSQFKITDNPYASSSCGCGTSFDIKI